MKIFVADDDVVLVLVGFSQVAVSYAAEEIGFGGPGGWLGN